jgi:hypothetical protein
VGSSAGRTLDPHAVEPPFGAWFKETVNGYSGQWLFHCHVSLHLKMGMQGFSPIDP